ncbi:peptidoglycan-binding protein [Halalkalibacter krulwichiae]|uniref:Minor extracellular protease Epr n=1 Tax=Halalkalibacter krulwichiae TaxID=199441 RepID=A0A1X9MFL9_9BACI|nr:peptidoglycan-binding protein [Halalkalibacter krulwichiae]ARK32206.1 Minor extracellular protease Epr precursor [Halalkalibacter krulwichiae]
MKNSLLFLFVSMIVFLSPFSALADSAETEKVIVVFKEQIDESLLAEVEGELLSTFEHVPAVSVEIPIDSIEELERYEEIAFIEVDHPVSISNQTFDWGIEKVKAPLAWQSAYTGKGVKVAVLDSGIAAHEDLKIAGGTAITSYTKSFHDDNGHGTHVAGIIGAKNNDIGVVGVAPDVELYAVKVLDQSGNGYISDIVKGIDWAITNKIDIINLSLGTSNDSATLKQMVDRAYDHGIILVAAAGNHGTGSGNTVEFPARYDSVIAVSAVDSNNKRGSFSATGPAVELTAPGVNVLSTHLNNRYVRQNGTSMASAYVTGTLALLKQQNPGLTPSEYRKKLQESAIDLAPSGRDEIFGYGLVQAPYKAEEEPAPEPPEEEESEDTKVIFKLGDRLPGVVQLKIDLEKAGFGVSSNPTVYYGPITMEQVKQFQKENGLDVTGEVDQRTLDTLRKIVEETAPEDNLPTFRQGDYHEGVIQLKLDLELAGFFVSTNPTNYYGSITTRKVREFQQAHGLPADGIAGPSTLRKLQEVVSGTLQEGDRLPGVVTLKLNLEKAGFRVSGSPTNYYGPITTTRVREFQSHYRLPVTGVADFATMQRLTEVTTTSLQEGDRLPDVIQLKLDLEQAGFRVSGSPTNYYGPITTTKVREFQSSVKLSPTGIATPETRRKLIETIRK